MGFLGLYLPTVGRTVVLLAQTPVSLESCMHSSVSVYLVLSVYWVQKGGRFSWILTVRDEKSVHKNDCAKTCLPRHRTLLIAILTRRLAVLRRKQLIPPSSTQSQLKSSRLHLWSAVRAAEDRGLLTGWNLNWRYVWRSPQDQNAGNGCSLSWFPLLVLEDWEFLKMALQDKDV